MIVVLIGAACGLLAGLAIVDLVHRGGDSRVLMVLAAIGVVLVSPVALLVWLFYRSECDRRGHRWGPEDPGDPFRSRTCAGDCGQSLLQPPVQHLRLVHHRLNGTEENP